MHKRLAKLVSQLIEERDGSAIPLIQLLFVMRSLERIGDLAVNVGEEVVFIESAEDIRHQ
jgi:phosphate transport system protein